jgi:DNA-binding NarL/FixJ family response regulator
VTRVVIAAASPAVRAGLAALLSAHPGFTLLEAVARPAGLADLAETVEADVVLLALEPGEPLPLPLALLPDRMGRAPAVVVLGDDPADGWVQRVLRSGARGALARAAVPASGLTPREIEVLGMLAEGLGNKVIAARLGISDHTVKTHVAAVFGKLGVSTRAEAVASAARLGLIML